MPYTALPDELEFSGLEFPEDLDPIVDLSREIFAAKNSKNETEPPKIDPVVDRERRVAMAIFEARAALSELEQDANCGNAVVQELLEYRDAVPSIEARIRRDVGLKGEQALKLLDSLSDTQLQSGFSRLIDKLRTNTDYLRELEDTYISAAIPLGLENGKYGAYVNFLDSTKGVAKQLHEQGGRGLYLPLFDLAFILTCAPQARSMWESLCAQGVLPQAVTFLDHELIHDTQTTKLRRALLWSYLTSSLTVTSIAFAKFTLLGFIGFQTLTRPFRALIQRGLIPNDTALVETHAFEGSAASPTHQMLHVDEREEIISHVAKYPGAKGMQEQAQAAFDLIRTLRVLGLDDRELGKLISRASYDGDLRTYPVLANRLSQERHRLGLIEQGLYERVKKALHARHELEIFAQRAIARELASKMLVKSCAEAAREG